MRCPFAFALTATLLSPLTEGLALHKRTDGTPKVLGVPIQRRSVPDPLKRDQNRLMKRDSLQVTLDNEKTLYFANVSLGTPVQSFRLHLDTGSSDLWVNSASSSLCQLSNSPCAESGAFSANASSTYKYLASDFNITYIDGSSAIGDYVVDRASIGGATIPSLQFGVGYDSTSNQGVLGIGYQSNEVQVGKSKKKAYSNLPAAMVDQGFISSNAYSVWLNDLDSSSGNILFGGIDTERFTPPLSTLPIQTFSKDYSDFLLTLTSLSFNNQTFASNESYAVLLDTGSSLTYLPNSMTSAIYEAIQAIYNSTQNAAFVPCTYRNHNATLDFGFSGVNISVSMRELVLDVSATDGSALEFSNGVPACLCGIAPSGMSRPVLGDTFLRSVYAVYDLANNEISLAQTKFNVSRSNILEIGTGVDAVPMATTVAHPVKATANFWDQVPNAGEKVGMSEIGVAMVVLAMALGCVGLW